jgi:DUF4097 and DUF4098 domain-containing protein YvlB
MRAPFLALALITLTMAGFAARAASVQGDITKTLAARSGGQLIVEVDFGNVEVKPKDRADVLVVVKRSAEAKTQARAKEMLDAHEVRIDQDGDRVQVTGKTKSAGNRGGWGRNGEHLEVQYTIEVPAHFDVDLTTGAGSILVEDLEGRVKTKTSGGNLTIGHIKGPIDATTGAGSIAVEGCSGAANLKSSGGNLTLGVLEGETKAETGAGSIHVKDARGALKAHTYGGNIEAERLESPAQLDTGAGSIRVKIAKSAAALKSGGGNLELNDAEASVTAHTGAGSINVKFTAQPAEDCRLTTGGGNVAVQIPETLRFDLDAQTMGGNLHTDLPVTTTVVGEHRTGVLKGKLNGGGKLLFIKTGAGSIHISK